MRERRKVEELIAEFERHADQHENLWAQFTLLVNAYRDELLPIDESWLKTRGEVIRDDQEAFGVRLGPSCTAIMERPSVFHSVLKREPSTIIHGTVQKQSISVVVKTRGELLDWERVLKGGV